MLYLLDFVIIQHYELAILCTQRHESQKPILWEEYEKQGRRPIPSLVLRALAINLGNSLLGIRDLINAGLDNQARILFRSYVEMADLTLALTASQNIFDAFTVSHPKFEDTYKHWRANLAPRKIREVLNTVHKEFASTESLQEFFNH